MPTPHCIPLEHLRLADIPIVGGKAAALGELLQELLSAGVRVPAGFAVTVRAYEAVLAQGDTKQKLHALLSDVDPENLSHLQRTGQAARDLIAHVGLPTEVRQSIVEQYHRLRSAVGSEIRVAVRSSATGEDLPEASFAGQQASFLGIAGERALLEACLGCFASVFTDRAIAYRAAHGFDQFAVRGAIAVQHMVRSDVGSAGVLFTLDPETGFRDVVVIDAAWGLGESVVAGRVDPDEIVLFKPTLDTAPSPIIRRRIGSKEQKIVLAGRGAAATQSVAVSRPEREKACLSDADALQLARWAVTIERHWAQRKGGLSPMDIEWAKDGTTGELFIVQARPETVHSRKDASFRRFIVESDAAPILRGIAIGQSVGIGPARVVRGIDDLLRVQKGDVIVADMTDPDWVPALRRAAGLVTNRGGRTCHAAIVSRELGVPCVVGTQDATATIHDGQTVTVSCAHGPQGRVFAGSIPFRVETAHFEDLEPLRTKIMLILGDPAQAFGLAGLPVAGVGLARQEFIIANHIGIHPNAVLAPDRIDDQARAHIAELSRGHATPADFYLDRLTEGIATIGAAFHPRPVIIRFSDFKSNEYARLIGGTSFEPHEENPMIGLRGASRYVHPDFAPAFALECRAIKRVRHEIGLANVHVMVPFCRTAAEGRSVLAAMTEAGLPRGQGGLEVWVMCEIPANVAAIDEFAAVFDGFSIGSNDLTQLVLGVDRDSELLAHLFDEHDTAVMRTIEAAIRGAHTHQRPIGLCGQAPSDDPQFAAFLVRSGIDSISLNPDALLAGFAAVARAERLVATAR